MKSKIILGLVLFLIRLFLAEAVAAAPVKIGIVNLSNLADAEVRPIAEALQIQVNRDFAPVYKQTAEVRFFNSRETLPLDIWKIYLVQNYNFPELGFHYVDSLGVPAARVSVERCRQNSKPESLVLSHELLEMIANPFVDRAVVVSRENDDQVELFLFEVSDAVMSAECGYRINDVLVSDFVYPQWFDRNAKGEKFSHTGCATRPLEIADNGYMPYLKLFKKKKGHAQWKRKF